MTDFSFGIIHWSRFDWQSFATIFAGAAAVVAAYIVGMKQTAILNRQVELEEANLRADLFERRMQTYEATADFVIHISAVQQTDPKAEERISRFSFRMRESQFLFSDPKVYPTLLSFWKKGNEARADRAVSLAAQNEGIQENNELSMRILEFPIWSAQTADSLTELFRHDLSIVQDRQRSNRRHFGLFSGVVIATLLAAALVVPMTANAKTPQEDLYSYIIGQARKSGECERFENLRQFCKPSRVTGTAKDAIQALRYMRAVESLGISCAGGDLNACLRQGATVDAAKKLRWCPQASRGFNFEHVTLWARCTAGVTYTPKQ